MGSNKKRLNEESDEYKVKRARNNEVSNNRFSGTNSINNGIFDFRR